MLSFKQFLQEDVKNDYDVGYHVTPSKNVKKILKLGSIPKNGPRAKALGEKHKAVYLFKSKEAAHAGVMNWLGDHFHENQKLSLLKVKIPHNLSKMPGQIMNT